VGTQSSYHVRHNIPVPTDMVSRCSTEEVCSPWPIPPPRSSGRTSVYSLLPTTMHRPPGYAQLRRACMRWGYMDDVLAGTSIEISFVLAHCTRHRPTDHTVTLLALAVVVGPILTGSENFWKQEWDPLLWFTEVGWVEFFHGAIWRRCEISGHAGCGDRCRPWATEGSLGSVLSLPTTVAALVNLYGAPTPTPT